MGIICDRQPTSDASISVCNSGKTKTKNNNRLTRNATAKTLAFFISIAIVISAASFTFAGETPIVLSMSGDQWKQAISVEPAPPAGGYDSGAEITIKVSLQRMLEGPLDFEQEFELSINNALLDQGKVFTGVDTFVGTNIPILVVKSYSTATVGDQTYVRYIYGFNPALAGLPDEDLISLVSTQFRATVKLVKVENETIIQNPIHVNDSEAVTVGEITIKPEPPKPPSGNINIEKSIGAVYRQDGSSAYGPSPHGNSYVKAGDIVCFNIRMTDNLSGYTENNLAYPVYNHFVEFLPKGYTGVNPGSNISGVGSSLNSGWVKWTQSTNTPALSGDMLTSAASFAGSGGEIWVYALSPPYDTGISNGVGPIPFYAMVKTDYSPAGDDLKNVVRTVDTTGENPKEAAVNVPGFGDPPDPPDPGSGEYDLALRTRIVTEAVKRGQYEESHYQRIVSRDQAFQILVVNQGTLPVDNVTVSLYLPENIQMLFIDTDGREKVWDPAPGDTNPTNGWKYIGLISPQDNPQKWAPVKLYKKTIGSAHLYSDTIYHNGSGGNNPAPKKWDASNPADVRDYIPGRTVATGLNGGDLITTYKYYGWDGSDLEFRARVTGEAEYMDELNTTLNESTWIYAAEISCFTPYTGPGSEYFESLSPAEQAGYNYAANDAASPCPVDEDSWPDSDPYNDLYYKNSGGNSVYGGFQLKTAMGSDRWIYEGANNTQKELPGDISGRAKQAGPGGRVDEDDYDFAAVRLVKPRPGADYSITDLEKTRLRKDEVFTPFNDYYRYWIIGTPSLGDYSYISDDGAITDINTCFLYKLTINAGSHDMTNMVLRDALPPGLKYITNFNFGINNYWGERYLLGAKFWWKAEELPDESRAVIPDSALHRESTSNPLNYGSGASGWFTAFAIPEVTPVPDINYQQIGITSLAADRSWLAGKVHYADGAETYIDNLTIKYINEHEIEIKADNLHETYIEIYLFVGLDSDPMNPLYAGQVFQNKVELTYDGVPKKEVMEDTYAFWDFDGNSAYYRKYVNSGSGTNPVWHGAERINVIEPDEHGNVTVEYRIQVLTKGGEDAAFSAGDIDIKDYIGMHAIAAGVTVTAVRDIDVKAYAGTGQFNGSDNITNTRIPGEDGRLAAVYENSILRITNPMRIEPGRLYDIRYKVEYTDIYPGKNIRNAVPNTVISVNPLMFMLKKVDDEGRLLDGAVFQLYYLSPNGTVNYSDPVMNTGATQEIQNDPGKAKPVTLGPGTNLDWESPDYDGYMFKFIPKNYMAQNSWRIALVETVAPDKLAGDTNPPYQSGRIYYMEIVKEPGGSLYWKIPGENGGDVYSYSSSGGFIYYFVNHNKPDDWGDIEINKTWSLDGAEIPDDLPWFYYIDTDDSSQQEKLFTRVDKGNGTYTYTTPLINTGLYRIVEYSPEGYGPADMMNWTLTGQKLFGGLAYDRYLYNEAVRLEVETISGDGGGPGEKTVHIVIDGVARENNVLSVENIKLGGVGLEKIWSGGYPGSENEPVIAPPNTRFFLLPKLAAEPVPPRDPAVDGHELEPGAGGFIGDPPVYTTRYSISGIPAGQYILYEYTLADGYEPDSEASDTKIWTSLGTRKIGDVNYKVFSRSLDVPAYTGGDGGGALTPALIVDNAADPAEIILKGTKTAVGGVMEQGQFSFSLYESDSNGVEGSLIQTVQNGPVSDDSALFEFDKLYYTKPGIHYYLIKETSVGGRGWTVDTAKYLIKVEVTGTSGTPTARYFIWAADADNDAGEWIECDAADILFENEYDPETSLEFSAKKTANIPMDAGQFSFTLYNSNSAGMRLGIQQITSNVAAGLSSAVEFAPIFYGATGTWYYLLAETSGGGNGWIMDMTEYLIEVVITDTGGTFLADVTYFAWDAEANDGDGAWVECDAAGLEFVNEYQYDDVIPYLSVEVDKDTIKRTSAAFDGREDQVDIYNVGLEQERYRYDINFRSNSNIEADEFIVEDPLEAVRDGYVRVDGLWTPAVWGDKDGRMNVWYKTFRKKTTSGTSAALPALPITELAGQYQVYPTPVFSASRPDGWKLWATIEQDAVSFANNGGVIERVKLDIKNLNLEEGDYIIAIRFEFGAVYAGFTSKNYDDRQVNAPADNSDNSNGVRNTNGSQRYINNGILKDAVKPADAMNVPAAVVEQLSIESDRSEFMTEALFLPETQASIVTAQLLTFTEIPARTMTGDLAPAQTPPEATKLATSPAIPVKGATSDWTPTENMRIYASGLMALPNTKEDSPLKPATYLVSAVRPIMTEVDIVSSVSAMIARNRAGERIMRDDDRDAVLTRELVPFSVDPYVPDAGLIVEEDSFITNARNQGLVLRNGVWYDKNGIRVTATGDSFALGLWMALAIAALIFTVLLIRISIALTPIPFHRKRRDGIVPEAAGQRKRRY